MYKCKKHGQLDVGYCKECMTVVHCGCKKDATKKLGDYAYVYDLRKGPKSIGIQFLQRFCTTCGKPLCTEYQKR